MKEILKVESILKQVKLIIEKNSKIEKETGGLFNIFSILNMERLEVKTHSALLYELLNPDGSHSQGSTYLKIFVNNVLSIENFDLNNVKVDRERNINSLGRVDLAIENQEHLIIIEIKIDAGDQKNQLKRYNEYGLRSGKDYDIYYLTLYGYEASNYSTGNTDINYKCISFETDILNWINKCIGAEKTPVLPAVRETLAQYLKLIEKITNQLDGGLKMEIKNLLLKDNNLEIAQQISKVIPYCRAELEYKFWTKLHHRYNEQIERLGLKYFDDVFFKDEKSDIENIVKQRKKKNGDIHFEYEVGDYNNKKIYLLIGCDGDHERIYVSFTIATEDKFFPFEENDKEMVNLIEKLGFVNSLGYGYNYVTYDLNFHTDSLLKLQNENTFNKAVKSIGDELLDIIKKVTCNKELNDIII
ncbi:PDDEXK-like family protein [Maledivibacter halophilus]|nr:PD-(D/E)XK nuclease family protein [Maledivibacter halophilus]